MHLYICMCVYVFVYVSALASVNVMLLAHTFRYWFMKFIAFCLPASESRNDSLHACACRECKRICLFVSWHNFYYSWIKQWKLDCIRLLFGCYCIWYMARHNISTRSAEIQSFVFETGIPCLFNEVWLSFTVCSVRPFPTDKYTHIFSMENRRSL